MTPILNEPRRRAPSVTRRTWLTDNAMMAAIVATRLRAPSAAFGRLRTHHTTPRDASQAARLEAHAMRIDPAPLQRIAQQAIDAARAAGASYADARLTRTVGHRYQWQSGARQFSAETEVQGIGVRVLVAGYWGFTAAASWDDHTAVQLARDAVAQAKINSTVSAQARGSSTPVNTSQAVELSPTPAVTGHWETPVQIDPFTVPVEEKLDTILSWEMLADRYGLRFPELLSSVLTFIRQERVLATSEGTATTQTVYESGGHIVVTAGGFGRAASREISLRGVMPAGSGWELIQQADIPGQLAGGGELMRAQSARGAKPAAVGRYTLVCDGATMAALVANTLGTATQLDRALGYEANAGGTSFLDDPLAMVGSQQVTSPLVTLTANRTAPGQLATVRWDDEGVASEEYPLINNGVLVDFQTTREQAAWLTPYYQKHGMRVRSHGCAASEDALVTPLQMMPNLALAPSASALRVDDLISDVRAGLFLEGGFVEADFQARTGLLSGDTREIINGRLGRSVNGGAIAFDTHELWKNVVALGGSDTTGVVGWSSDNFIDGGHGTAKGEPSQATSYSAQGVAATITNQPVIDPGRKA